jgi:hypothetical protein
MGIPTGAMIYSGPESFAKEKCLFFLPIRTETLLLLLRIPFTFFSTTLFLAIKTPLVHLHACKVYKFYLSESATALRNEAGKVISTIKYTK